MVENLTNTRSTICVGLSLLTVLVIISMEDDQPYVLAEVSPVQANTGMHDKMMNLKSNIVRAKAYALLAQEKKANGLSSQGKPPPEKSQSEHQAERSIVSTMLARLAHDPQATNVMGEYAAIIGRMKGEIRVRGQTHTQASNLLLQIDTAIKEGSGIIVSDGKTRVKLGIAHKDSHEHDSSMLESLASHFAVPRTSFNAMATMVGQLNAHSSHLEALAAKARQNQARTLMQQAKSKAHAIMAQAMDKVTALLAHDKLVDDDFRAATPTKDTQLKANPHPGASHGRKKTNESAKFTRPRKRVARRIAVKHKPISAKRKAVRMMKDKHQERSGIKTHKQNPTRMSFEQWELKDAKSKMRPQKQHTNNPNNKPAMKVAKKSAKKPTRGTQPVDDQARAKHQVHKASEPAQETMNEESAEERLSRYVNADAQEEDDYANYVNYEEGLTKPETPEQFIVDEQQQGSNKVTAEVPKVQNAAKMTKVLTRAQIVAYAKKISEMKAAKAEEASAFIKAQEAALAQAMLKEEKQQSQTASKAKQPVPPVALDAHANTILTSLLSRSERGTQILNRNKKSQQEQKDSEDMNAHQEATEAQKKATRKSKEVMKQPTDKKPPKKAKTIDFLEFEEEFNREAAKVLEKSDSATVDQKRRVAVPYIEDLDEDENEEDEDDLVKKGLWTESMRSHTNAPSTHPFRKFVPKPLFAPKQNLESQLSKLKSGPRGDEDLKDIMRAGQDPLEADVFREDGEDPFEMLLQYSRMP